MYIINYKYISNTYIIYMDIYIYIYIIYIYIYVNKCNTRGLTLVRTMRASIS